MAKRTKQNKKLTKDQVKKNKKKFIDFLSKNAGEDFNAEDLGAMVGVSVFSASKMLTTLVNHKEIVRMGKKGKYRYFYPTQTAKDAEGVFVVIHHGQSSQIFNDLAEACGDAKKKVTEADTDYVYVARLIKSFSVEITEEDIV